MRYVIRKVFICASDGSITVFYFLKDTLDDRIISESSQGLSEDIEKVKEECDSRNRRRVINL